MYNYSIENKNKPEDFISASIHEFRKFILFGTCSLPGEHVATVSEAGSWHLNLSLLHALCNWDEGGYGRQSPRIESQDAPISFHLLGI